MSEIMSAEELIVKLRAMKNGTKYVVPDWYDCEKIIKARDSAMLEKYKEAIATWQLKGQPGGTLALLDALDSAFAEIEGRK